MSLSRILLGLLAPLVMLTLPLKAAAECGGSADPTHIPVNVTNLRSADGFVTLTVYPDDPKRFLSPGGKLSRIRVQAVKPITTVCLAVPGPGTYAIAVYHDENGNRKFDRTLLGLPAEGYGFSRNPTGLIGLPSFDKVSFLTPLSEPLTIRLTY